MSAENISVIAVEEIDVQTDEELHNPENRTKSPENKRSYWNGIHIITILGIVVVCLSPQMLIPRKNSIYMALYWYESNLMLTVLALFASVQLVLNVYAFTKQRSLLSISMFAKIFLWGWLGWVSTYCATYAVWVLILGFNHPLPFNGDVCFFVSWIIRICGVWIVFPSQLLTNLEFRNKMKTYMLYSMWWFIIGLQSVVLAFLFKQIRGIYQSIFALIIPVARECNKKILSKLVSKMNEGDDEMATVVLGLAINVHYAFLVTIWLAGAETLTIISILAMDFFLHLWTTYKVIKSHKKVSTESLNQTKYDKAKKRALMKLLLAESVEGFVPITFAIEWLMAFFGPNSGIIGNVGADFWAYRKVEEVGRLLIVLFVLFGVDCLSVAANGYWLWKSTKINLIQELCRLLEKYWIFIAMKLVHDSSVYFIRNDINLAADLTLRFEWITDDGWTGFIRNSTQLSNEDKNLLLQSKG